MGENSPGARSRLTDQRVILALGITLTIGMVAGAVFAVRRVQSLNSELAATEVRSQADSEGLLETIASLEEELDESRTAIEEHETAGAAAEELERENRALKNCATEAQPRGRPRVTLLPSHGTPGTRVEVVGHCFTSPFWRGKKDTKGTGIGLWSQLDRAGNPNPSLRTSRCELVAGKAGKFDIEEDGRMRGHFVVPSSGRCVGSKESSTMPPGGYMLIIGCRQCSVGRFQITTPTSEKDRLPACSGRDWRLTLKEPARSGGVVLVGVQIDSTAGARCHLSREMTLTLTGAGGSPLSVEGNPVEADVDAVVGDEISALWAWSNWCGATTSLSVLATIQEKESSRTLSAVPQCHFRKRSSVLQGLTQWTKGVNP